MSTVPVRDLSTEPMTPFAPLIRALQVVGHSPTNFVRSVEIAREVKANKGSVFFVGNGGSAAIASHMAADWLKNGQMAAQCFTDGPLTTCIANDIGYASVFALPLGYHGRPNDLLFCISSSGQSRSITHAAEVGLRQGLHVITLSGFEPDNPLRQLGDVNFYVPSGRYGVVEISHHAILHAILEAVMEC